MRYIICVIIIFIIGISCQEGDLKKPYKTGMEGKPLPDFNIQLADSITYIKSTNISAGKDLLLFYFSPTCPYCRAQLRDMLDNMEAFKDKQLCFLTSADLTSLKMFTNYFQIDHLQGIIIGRDTGNVIPKKYSLPGVPFTAYFDKNNDLRKAYSGRLVGNTLLQIGR